MCLDFIDASRNIILCGPNGVGKSTIACNIAHQAVLQGHTVLFVTAGQMLNELAAQDGDNALRRRIKYYTQPSLLVVDEVGFIYVTDAQFNNFTIYDVDFSLLTFVGGSGTGPGQFYGASGIGVQGDEIAVVDQLGARLQVLRFVTPKDE